MLDPIAESVPDVLIGPITAVAQIALGPVVAHHLSVVILPSVRFALSDLPVH